MTTTKTAIRTLLGADATYKSLIGSSSSPFKTYYRIAPQPPDFPFVVFWLRPGRNNQEMSDLLSTQYEMVAIVWGQAGDNYEGIADRIKKVLHHKYDSNGDHFIFTGEPEELFDAETNAYGLRLTFNTIYRGGL